MDQNKGFTLIELLVVIAIITLLVSILMPSLQKAKDLARRVVCLSNQRSILIGVLAYTSDNDGLFPTSTGLGWEYSIFNEEGFQSSSTTSDVVKNCGICPDYVSWKTFYCPGVASNAYGKMRSDEDSWNYGGTYFDHLTHYWLYFANGLEPQGGYMVSADRGFSATIPGENSTYGGKASSVVAMTCWPEHYELSTGEAGVETGFADYEGGHGEDGLPVGYLDGHAVFLQRSELIFDNPANSQVGTYLRAIARPFIGQRETPHSASCGLDEF